LMIGRIVPSTIVGLWISNIAFGAMTSRKAILEEGFEEGIKEWDTGMDLPEDPETGMPVNSRASISNRICRSGYASLELTIDGRQGEGTLWVQRYLELERTGDLLIEISFQLYSEQESFNTIAHVVAFLGMEEPIDKGSFHRIGVANRIAGWSPYVLKERVFAEHKGIWIAIGIAVAWETWMTYSIDDVTVYIT